MRRPGRSIRFAWWLALACAACATRVDLDPRDPDHPPVPLPLTAAERALAWTDPAILCATGSVEVVFDRVGRVRAFPISLASGARLQARIEGNEALDTTLAVFGPIRPDGSWGDAPLADADDPAGASGVPGPERQPSLVLEPQEASGTYVIAVSTWRGRGLGVARLIVTVDGVAGCPARVQAAGPFGLAGDLTARGPCVAAACEVPDPLATWKEIQALRSADPCVLLDEGTGCRWTVATQGADWAERADRAVEVAGLVAGQYSSAQVGSLACLARLPREGVFATTARPGARSPAAVLLAGPRELVAASGEVTNAPADWVELASSFAAEPGSILTASTALGPFGPLEQRFVLRSWRGVPVVPQPGATVAARYASRWQSETFCKASDLLEDVVAGPDLVPAVSPQAWTKASAIDAGATALAACGAACVPLGAAAEVVAAGRAAWAVRFRCPSACSGREAWTCTWFVDALDASVLSGGPDCCEDCGVVEPGCAEPVVATSGDEVAAALPTEWPVVSALYGFPSVPVSGDVRIEVPLRLDVWALGASTGCAGKCAHAFVEAGAGVAGAVLLGTQWSEGRRVATGVRLDPGTYRFRNVLLIDASTGILSALITVLPACSAPCPTGTWRCPRDGTCIDADLESSVDRGVRFCTDCAGGQSEVCACGGAAAARPDGRPCRLLTGPEEPVDTACSGGSCQVVQVGLLACSHLAGVLRERMADPSVRLCGGDGDCVVVGGAATCAEAPLLGAPGGQAVAQASAAGIEELFAVFRSDRCAAWRELAPRTAGIRPGPARCADGFCVVEGEPCP